MYNLAREFNSQQVIVQNPLKYDSEFYSELLRVFFDSANDAIFVLCDEMKFLVCNKITEEWLDKPEEFLTEHNNRIPITCFFSDDKDTGIFKNHFHEAITGVPVKFECQILPGTDFSRWVEFNMKRVNVDDADMVIVVGRDVSEKKLIQDEVLFESSHDHLTRLHSREFFIHHVQSRIKSSKTKSSRFSVIVLNIKRFRIFNEVLGHRLADKVLQHTADTLKRILPEDSYVSRFGSNEYAFICSLAEKNAIKEFIETLLKDFEDPLLVDASVSSQDKESNSIPVNLDFSVGISVFPDHAETADLLSLRAELALKFAKKSQDAISFFEISEQDSQSLNDLEFIGDFKKALSEDQFIIYFQPKIRISDSRVMGAEILSRWNHPLRGILAPDLFLPQAEEMNLFRAFSRLLINKSFSLISALSQKYKINFAVNLSPYNLLESDFIEFMKESLISHKIRAENITLEITETGMMLDKDLSHEVMNDLAGLGFSLAVDDFGIGYTSLSYLQGLPLHELKIDRSFITNIHNDFNNSVIVKSLILLGQSLGMYITAEGVEKQEELDVMKKYGCNLVQGFHFARPMSYEMFEEYMGNQS